MRRSPWRNPFVVHSLVLGIVIADWLTPAGVVVGMLLCVPILISSAGDDRRQVLAVTLTSTTGFIIAAIFGRGPVSPQAVWLPNRVFALVAIASSCVLALLLQRRRLQAETARAQAESARDLSRLLHSLMAHDLRAPLSLARQTLEVIAQPLRNGLPVDLDLVADVDARLRRSLRATELVLDSARAELVSPERARIPSPLLDVGHEIAEEVALFREEAASRGKELTLNVSPDPLSARTDPSVLRQSVAILVDNAIRHASPGLIRVSATEDGGRLMVTISDDGPGLSRRRAETVGAGEGLGLRLCGLLAQRAGGTLAVTRDAEDGTEIVLRLPAG